MGFDLPEKYCSELFLLSCSSFLRNNVCKKCSFPSGIFWISLVEWKTKETLLLFCWTANRQTFYSVCVNQIPWKLREPIRRNQTGNTWQNVFCCRSTHVPVPVRYLVLTCSVPVHILSLFILFCSHSVSIPSVSILGTHSEEWCFWELVYKWMLPRN